MGANERREDEEGGNLGKGENTNGTKWINMEALI